MSAKKIDLSETKALLKKTKGSIVKSLDQNDDGLFGKDDIAIVAEKVSDTTKKATKKVKETADEISREYQNKMLKPIFMEDLDSADFLMPKMICITEMDKKHAESDVCKDSIGYTFEQDDLRVVCIYRDKVEYFGLTFYPNLNDEVYYLDPSEKDRYIALDEYFSYLKDARVRELQKIAQDLGAKHFCITYKEKKTSFTKKDAKTGLTAKAVVGKVKADATKDTSVSEVSFEKIMAESDFPGHDPIKPQLAYLLRDQNIQSLVDLRMDSSSPLSHQKYIIELSKTSGIKEKDAMKIDATLKAMKFSANVTITSEVQNETRSFFEYEIDF